MTNVAHAAVRTRSADELPKVVIPGLGGRPIPARIDSRDDQLGVRGAGDELAECERVAGLGVAVEADDDVGVRWVLAMIGLHAFTVGLFDRGSIGAHH